MKKYITGIIFSILGFISLLTSIFTGADISLIVVSSLITAVGLISFFTGFSD